MEQNTGSDETLNVNAQLYNLQCEIAALEPYNDYRETYMEIRDLVLKKKDIQQKKREVENISAAFRNRKTRSN